MKHKLLTFKSERHFKNENLKIIFLILILLNISNYSHSSEIHFIDMKKILNKSKAGKGAQEFLKKIISRN